jgi:hypothetical protein
MESEKGRRRKKKKMKKKSYKRDSNLHLCTRAERVLSTSQRMKLPIVIISVVLRLWYHQRGK